MTTSVRCTKPPRIAQGLSVQVARGDARGVGRGEVGGDVVMHVGDAAGHADRRLVAGGTLGDAVADRGREREL
jgi:hypothetical protein